MSASTVSVRDILLISAPGGGVGCGRKYTKRNNVAAQTWNSSVFLHLKSLHLVIPSHRVSPHEVNSHVVGSLQ